MRYVIITLALLAGTARADDPAEIRALKATIARLETRLQALEQANAKYAEALDFLQKVYEQQKQQTDEHDRNELATDGVYAIDIAQDLKSGQVEGPASALVTIVMAFDFADPFGHRMRPILKDVLKDYAGKVRIVYKHMIVHPQTITHAHLAACAAGNQHKFVEFWHAYWELAFEPYVASRDPTKLDGAILDTIAAQLRLDPTRFKADLASTACEQRIKADQTELESFKVNSTPTFFINGTYLAGAVPKETFIQLLDERLKVAEASKVAGAKYYDKEIMGKGERKFRSKKDPKPR